MYFSHQEKVRKCIHTYVRITVCMYVCKHLREHILHTDVCTYVRITVCTYVPKYVCTFVNIHCIQMYVRMYHSMYICSYVCTFEKYILHTDVCTYVSHYVRMYVRMYAPSWIYVCTYIAYRCMYWRCTNKGYNQTSDT